MQRSAFAALISRRSVALSMSDVAVSETESAVESVPGLTIIDDAGDGSIAGPESTESKFSISKSVASSESNAPGTCAGHPVLVSHAPKLVYNRVNKAGSTFMSDLMQKTIPKEARPIREGSRYKLPYGELRSKLLNLPAPGVYVNHDYCLAELLPLRDEYAFINMVRDPLARLQSLYYYQVDPTHATQRPCFGMTEGGSSGFIRALRSQRFSAFAILWI